MNVDITTYLQPMALQKALDVYTAAKSALLQTPQVALELEMRFKLTSAQFATIYNSAVIQQAAKTLECTYNMLSNEGGKSRIRQVTFVAGKATSNIYRSKQSVYHGQVPGYINYNVAVAKETNIDPFTSNHGFLRYKARVSCQFGTHWRADFTVTYSEEATKVGQNAKRILLCMFPADLSVDNYLAKMGEVDTEYGVVYEFELEYIGATLPTLANFDVTKQIFSLLDPRFEDTQEMNSVLEKIAACVFQQQPTSLSQKGVACQAIALSKAVYYNDVYPPVGYIAYLKSDGQRVLVMINNSKCYIVYGNSMVTIDGPAGDTTSLIADGEEVVTISGKKIIQLFDAISINVVCVASQQGEKRVLYLDEAAECISKYTPCEAKKPLVLTEDFASQLATLWRSKVNHLVDGIILMQGGRDYRSTRNYKWKPADKNTTDFLAVRCPDFMMHSAPFIRQQDKTLYLLYVGIRDELRRALGIGFLKAHKKLTKGLPQGATYYPIQFSSCENPQAFLYYHAGKEDLHGKVVELQRTDNTVLGWKFERLRPERETGNDYVVAERNYFNVLDPFTLSDLCTKQTGYFTQISPAMRKAPNRFNRYALEVIYDTYMSKTKTLIDLGSGRGADLFRYADAGVQRALFIDKDAQALAELVRRRLDSAQVRKNNPARYGARESADERDITGRIISADFSKLIEKDGDQMTTMVMEADLADGSSLVAQCKRYSMYPGAVDGIICNMALHYLCDSKQHIDGVLQFAAQMLAVSGCFLFVVMDGQKVFDLLTTLDKGQTWVRDEQGTPKYYIRKDYSGRSFAKTGQEISVLLPFVEAGSSKLNLRPEPLCNVEYVKELAAGHGLRCVSDNSVIEFAKGFQRDFVDLSVRLTEDDKTYLGLHRIVCLMKE